MALGATSKQLFYHNNFVMKPSKEKKISASSDSKTPPIEEPSSMLFTMRNTFRKKIAMEMNVAQKGKNRSKTKHLENESSLLQLCEKNKKFIHEFNENTKENSRRKIASEHANRLKKLPPISHHNKNNSDNNTKKVHSDNDISTISQPSNPGIWPQYQGMVSPLRNNGHNTLTNGKSRLSSLSSNYEYKKTINESPPDMSKLHLVRNKRKQELKKVNAKHSSPTTVMEHDLLQPQSDFRKPLLQDKEKKSQAPSLRNPISSTKIAPADVLEHGFEDSLSDFQKWQVDRDKEKQMRLSKFSKQSNNANMLLDAPIKTQPTQPVDSFPNELLQFPAKSVRKNVKRRQEHISSTLSVSFHTNSDVGLPGHSQQSKEELHTKPIGISPDLRGPKPNNKNHGSPNFPANAVISGLNKPVLVRHDGRSNASSRTSTRNAFYSQSKAVPSMEGEQETYKKIPKTDSHFSSNTLKDELNNASSIPEQANVVLHPCRICGRKFRSERLDKHVAVCSKASGKKRRVFNMSKVRKKGTDMEKFTFTKGVSSRITQSQPHKNNWRSQHEDFIKTIRHAKMVTSYVKEGGNLSDLPPPEPSLNPDYVTCDYCQRRFAPQVAERHIPRCKDIKSRPPPPKSRVPRNKRK